MTTVFDCRMCGHCCEGEGGIVLGPRDLERLCVGFGLAAQPFLDAYATLRNGKWHVRTGDDGNCIFFRSGKGCSVHPHKPDVCRAWPYFHGNMVDALSLEMAKNFCPGIRQDVNHTEFVAEGSAYLQEHHLVADDPSCEGCALLPAAPSPCDTNRGEGTKKA